MRFSAALPMRNFEALEARLNEVANPKSADYGQWMTRDQVSVEFAL